jgi:hypothetical protein
VATATSLLMGVGCGVGLGFVMDVVRVPGFGVFDSSRFCLRFDTGLIALGPKAVNMGSDDVEEPWSSVVSGTRLGGRP